jgi:hypothetical protein
MFDIPSYLDHYQEVIKAFGYWPDFHDAPVISCSFRDGSDSTLDLALQAWEMTDELDARGYFIARKHHLVYFRFAGITEAEVHYFTDVGNILFRISFSPVEQFHQRGRFLVGLESAMGGDMGGKFYAEAGGVRILPCDEKGNPI